MSRLVFLGALLLISLSLKAADPFGGAKTCFLLYNLKTKAFDEVIGKQVCRERLSPCSTFKVPLAVMAFDSGVLKDEKQILKWDGVVGARPEVNRDQDAQTWMRDSVVWFSQRLTVKMGQKKLQAYLNDFDYGNRNLSAGLKTAWLTSAPSGSRLKISGYEQLEFMKKLWGDQLPASKRSQSLARELTRLEVSPKGWALHGKTGSGSIDKAKTLNLGWFIGHLGKGDQQYLIIASTQDVVAPLSKEPGGPKTKQAVKAKLEVLGLW